MRKQASLGTMALSAGAATAANRIALGTKRLGRSMADQAAAGAQGKAVAESKLRSAVEGAVVPDVEAMKRQAYNAGRQFTSQLRGKPVSKRDLVQLRRATRGDFTKLLASGGQNSPAVKAALSTDLGKQVGSAVVPALNRARRAGPEAVRRLEESYKKNKFASNVLGNITRPRGKDTVRAAADNVRRRVASAGSLVGAAVEPIAGALAARRLVMPTAEGGRSLVRRNLRGAASKAEDVFANLTDPARGAITGLGDKVRGAVADKGRQGLGAAAREYKAHVDRELVKAYKTGVAIDALARREFARRFLGAGYVPSTMSNANRALVQRVKQDDAAVRQVTARIGSAAKQGAIRAGQTVQRGVATAGRAAASGAQQLSTTSKYIANAAADTLRRGAAAARPIAAEVAALPVNTVRAGAGLSAVAGRAIKDRIRKPPTGPSAPPATS